MADFVGHDIAVATQKRLRDMHPVIEKTPSLANGGRVLNVLDPDTFGWDNIRDYVMENKFVGLTMVPKEETLAKARKLFGETVDLPYWDVFTGQPEEVLRSCEYIFDGMHLPVGWKFESKTDLTDGEVDQVQALSAANGVAPTPAYYLKGEAVPSITTCLWDDAGTLVGCANATMRYHPDGPLAGTLFAGGVAVDPAHRGKGLGTLINAAMLYDSYSPLGWTQALEQARVTNLASCGMIQKCGLTRVPDHVTVAINLSSKAVTR